MKKILLFLLPVLIIGITLYSIQRMDISMPQPVETVIVDGEDEGHFIKKQEWFDAMHRADSGTNWKQMDMESRITRLENPVGTKNITGTWSEVGSNNLAGRTHLCDYDHETGEVYLITSGGNIWRGTPSNNDWQCVNDHFQITGAHFFRRIPHNDGERWCIASKSWNIQGFLYSDDQGQTWSYTTGLENVASWGTMKRAVMTIDNGNPVFYALAMEWDYTNWNKIICVYKSTDLGESFEKILQYDEPEFGSEAEFDLWSDYKQNTTVYIVENENFGIIDENNQVVPIGELPAVSGDARLTGFDNGTTKKFYLSKTNNNYTTFYGSDDGGISWTARGNVNEGPFHTNSFVASVINPDILYFGGVTGFRSEDGGASWTKVNEWWEYYGNEETMLHADLPGINPFEIDGEELLFISTDGGTYISTDHMATVQNISLENLRISQYYSTLTYEQDHNVIYAGSQDQGYQRSVAGQTGDDVYNFDQLISGDYGHLVSGDGGASSWCVYPGFAMYYPDAVTGTASKTWDFIGSGHFWMPQLMEDPYDPASCYYAGGSTTSGSHIFHLQCPGYYISHTEQDFDFSEGGDAQISAMAYSKVNPANRYVLTSEGGFFYSHNDGVNWTKSQSFNGPGCHYFYGASIVVSQNNPNTIYIGGSGYSTSPVFVSYDGGVNFEEFRNNLPGTLVFDMVLNDSETTLFAATEIGAFACDIMTGEWTDLFYAGVPDQAFWSVEWVGDFARFATYGRGIWDFTPHTSPLAGFLADNTDGCEGLQVLFQDVSTNDPDTWLWEFQGGEPTTVSTQTPPPILYNNAGLFDVSLTVSGPGGTNTKVMTDYIEVIPVPETLDEINAPDSVKLTDEITPVSVEEVQYADSYIWTLIPDDAGTITSEVADAEIVWYPGFVGVAEISVAAKGECGTGAGSEPHPIVRYHNVGIDSMDNPHTLHPNPAKNSLNYKLPKDAKQITVVNSVGKRITTIEAHEGVINVSSYEPGLYYMIYHSKNKMITTKFIVVD